MGICPEEGGQCPSRRLDEENHFVMSCFDEGEHKPLLWKGNKRMRDIQEETVFVRGPIRVSERRKLPEKMAGRQKSKEDRYLVRENCRREGCKPHCLPMSPEIEGQEGPPSARDYPAAGAQQRNHTIFIGRTPFSRSVPQAAGP